jgi:site-specific DNA recombinase
MTTIGYVRVSTEEQMERFGPALQESAIRSFCESQSLPPPTIFHDVVSGASDFHERPGFSAMMREVGEGSTIVVYKLDRIARRAVLVHGFVERVLKLGAGFRSVTEPFSTDNAAGRLLLDLLAVFAGFERDLFRERSKAGKREAVRKGRWWGGVPPLGYRVANGRLVVDRKSADQVRALFAAYLQPGATIESTAATCDVPKTTVSYLMRNPIYVGQPQFGGEVADVPRLRIVTDEVWAAVERKRLSNRIAVAA